MGNVMELVDVPKQKVTLSLETEVMSQIDELVKEVASWPATQEFGVKVTREVAARVALLRGLQSLKKSPTPGLSEPPTPKSDGNSVTNDIETEPESETPVDPNVDRNPDGTIQRPNGWQEWSTRDRLPDEQDLLHTYYTAHGWKRMWGKVGQNTISFYWSDDESAQDLEAFVGGEEELMVQATPWGPGHIIPKGWRPKEE